MKLPLVVLISILCTMHISNAMKNTKQDKKKKYYHHPLYECMLFSDKNKKIFPKEILHYIYFYYKINLSNSPCEICYTRYMYMCINT